MKSIVIAAAILILVFKNLNAQVPESITKKFENKYPYVTDASWQSFDNGYKVYFTGVKNLRYIIEFDTAGIALHQYREALPKELTPGMAIYISSSKEKVWIEKLDSGKNKYFLQKNDTLIKVSDSEKTVL
jgi:hypothetical protein